MAARRLVMWWRARSRLLHGTGDTAPVPIDQDDDMVFARSDRPLALVGLVALVSVLATGCDDSDDGSPATTPIAAADVVAAVSSGLDGIGSLRTDTDVIGFVGDTGTVFLRVDTRADLDAGVATMAVSQPLDLASDEFIVTEETAVTDGVASRRSPDGAWEGVDEQIATMLFAGLVPSDGDVDLDAVIGTFLHEVPGGWSVTSEGGSRTYLSTPQPDGTFVEIEADSEGRPIRFTQEQRPAGADVDDIRRFRTVIELSGFDTTNVVLPDNLPSTGT